MRATIYNSSVNYFFQDKSAIYLFPAVSLLREAGKEGRDIVASATEAASVQTFATYSLQHLPWGHTPYVVK